MRCARCAVPTGKVKWFDTEKGFGFLSRDDGGEVFVHQSALPEGVEALKPGSRVEFGVAEGRRGEQALSVRILEVPAGVATARKPPEDMAIIVEDLIKLLDRLGNGLRRGKAPAPAESEKVAKLLRAVADDLD